VFRGLSKTNLPGSLGFFQFLRTFRQLTACEQAEMIVYAALDPAVASRARRGDFVRCLATSTCYKPREIERLSFAQRLPEAAQ
jgi:hypothetical protein